MISSIRKRNRPFNTAQTGDPTYAITNFLQASTVTYDEVENKSYISWSRAGGRTTAVGSKRGVISRYDHATKKVDSSFYMPLPTRYYSGGESDNYVDTHLYPVNTISSAGKVIIGIEEVHNCKLRRLISNVNRSLTGGFTETVHIAATTNTNYKGLAYPSIYRAGSYIAYTGRLESDYFAVCRSYDSAAFSEPIKVTDLGVRDKAIARHYTMKIPQAVGGERGTSGIGWHAIVMRRENTPAQARIQYTKLYYMHSPDNVDLGKIWNNKPAAHTFGRDVFTNGVLPLTEAELDAHYLVKSVAIGATDDVFLRGAFICPATNKPFLLVRNQGAGTHTLFYMNASNAWVQRTFTLPGFAFLKIVPQHLRVMTENKIELVSWADHTLVDGMKHMTLHVSTDMGLTWKYEKTLYKSPKLEYHFSMTDNANPGNKFLLVGKEYNATGTNGDYSDLVIVEF